MFGGKSRLQIIIHKKCGEDIWGYWIKYTPLETRTLQG